MTLTIAGNEWICAVVIWSQGVGDQSKEHEQSKGDASEGELGVSVTRQEVKPERKPFKMGNTHITA